MATEPQANEPHYIEWWKFTVMCLIVVALLCIVSELRDVVQVLKQLRH